MELKTVSKWTASTHHCVLVDLVSSSFLRDQLERSIISCLSGYLLTF